MNKKVKILIFCMIFVVGGVFGQKTVDLNHKITIPVFTKASFPQHGDTVYQRRCYDGKKFLKYYKQTKCDSLNKAPISFINNYSINIIAPNYYTQNFGFFCKKELQLQKATKVPFVFRLGSVEMCDRMEGKGR
jgi:hypothetical protein